MMDDMSDVTEETLTIARLGARGDRPGSGVRAAVAAAAERFSKEE